MRAKQLKEKYPDYWSTVERDVKNDIIIRSVVCDDVDVISHNAAFIATYELHKYLKKVKK